eukprot:248729-Pelagomonas_calceolata.AAC.1
MSGKAKETSKANGRLQDVQVIPTSFLQQGKSNGVSNSEQISIAKHFFLNGLKLKVFASISKASKYGPQST